MSGKKELNAKRNYNSNDNLLILEKARTVLNSHKENFSFTVHSMEHWVVFIIKTNADVGDGERVQNYNKPVHVTKSVIKKGKRNMVIL